MLIVLLLIVLLFAEDVTKMPRLLIVPLVCTLLFNRVLFEVEFKNTPCPSAPLSLPSTMPQFWIVILFLPKAKTPVFGTDADELPARSYVNVKPRQSNRTLSAPNVMQVSLAEIFCANTHSLPGVFVHALQSEQFVQTV